jgi:hypothetical protein
MSIVTYNNRSIANISAIPGAAKSLTHIKTLTASSSATLSFVDGSDDVVLDSTYPIYKFEFINMHPATDNVKFTFQCNASGGSGFNETMTSTFFNAAHAENDGFATLSYRTAEDQAQGTGFQTLSYSVGADADQSFSGYLKIFNPSSTTFVKHFMSTNCINEKGNAAYESFVAGYINNTSAIDEFQFKFSSGNIDAGTIKLYGLKDS